MFGSLTAIHLDLLAQQRPHGDIQRLVLRTDVLDEVIHAGLELPALTLVVRLTRRIVLGGIGSIVGGIGGINHWHHPP